MSRGKHARRRSWARALAQAAAIPVAAGLAIAGVATLLDYSPYVNPGALDSGLWMLAAAVAVPAAVFMPRLVRGAVREARRYSAWKKTLAPGQRTELLLFEAAAMEFLHMGMAARNRETSAALTASVMGSPRGEDTAG